MWPNGLGTKIRNSFRSFEIEILLVWSTALLVVNLLENIPFLVGIYRKPSEKQGFRRKFLTSSVWGELSGFARGRCSSMWTKKNKNVRVYFRLLSRTIFVLEVYGVG